MSRHTAASPSGVAWAVWAALAAAAALAGCATPVGPGDAAEPLRCSLPSRCVDTQPAGHLAPLRYTGTPQQAMTALRATLATFEEARIEIATPLRLVAVFTTAAGFQDEVEFRIDADRQQIDYRSRSLLGLFDFGKNGQRMREFTVRWGAGQR